MKQSLEAEFTPFVAERGPMLLRIAHALTGDPRAAEDLVQGALAKAYGGQILGLEDADAVARLYDADGRLLEEMTLPSDFDARRVSIGTP
ncbi:hypothetical protein Aab01nite_56930 [Paractinoplanes abujensis]|uniref:DNA-directed RNA polymerase specialized sigma24 family protein n=1 Tax=Paractinoplanes abujensis TaxID=882441 RepID=A0A7W7G4N6_9ACTN|nr:sigma factor [Actinoplanes abujensis]MBB4696112.1 DNA-directed RNA polymerase specialized sigma24 family protein [Actinoplanes abujensis]GID22103.1 hypothetical protein Aab01nite_56930 [Actinoplanes abujensis]